MGTDGRVLGRTPKPGIELPAPCIGEALGKGVGSCEREGTIALMTLVPMGVELVTVLLTVCPDHVRGARLYLNRVRLPDDLIETYATRTLAEHFDVIERSGIEPLRLLSA